MTDALHGHSRQSTEPTTEDGPMESVSRDRVSIFDIVKDYEWADREDEDVRAHIAVEEYTRGDDAALLAVGRVKRQITHAVSGQERVRSEVVMEPIGLTPEQAFHVGVRLIQAAQSRLADEHDEDGPVNYMTYDQRWILHVLACGLQDCTFWEHQDPRWPDHWMFTEVETGTSAWGNTAEEARSNYFAHNFDMPHPAKEAS